MFPELFVKEAVFSPTCFGPFVRNQMAVIVSVASVLFYWSMCLLLRRPCCFYLYGCVVSVLKLGIRIVPGLLFLFRISLTILGLLCFCMNFRIFFFFFSSVKTVMGIWMGAIIESVDNFQKCSNFINTNSAEP